MIKTSGSLTYRTPHHLSVSQSLPDRIKTGFGASRLWKRSGGEIKWSERRKSKEVATFVTYEGKIQEAVTPLGNFAIVAAKFNSLVTKQLVDGAHKAFLDHGIPDEKIDVYWVPGSFELPSVTKQLLEKRQYVAVVCIGAVIRGGTSHYDAVVNAATSGILQASMASDVPVIFGVLTCDTLEQALDRAGGKMGNKGYEAALSAMEMSNLRKYI